MKNNKHVESFGKFNENLINRLSNKKINESMDDLFQAEYKGDKIKIKGKFLKLGEERDLLKKLKKFNLGSGHEEMKLSKIDDDNFVFRLETYVGGPTQTIYFERLEKI